MKIKRFDWSILFYPNILNPLCWLVVWVLIIGLVFTSWWKRQREEKYWIYSIDKEGIKNSARKLVEIFMGVLINTIWWNRDLTNAYTRYLEEKWFPYYPIGDWRREYNLDRNYKYYLNVKAGKFKKK